MGMIVAPPPVQPTHGGKIQTTSAERRTRLSKVANSFRSVLLPSSSSSSPEKDDDTNLPRLDVARLLDACRTYAEFLRDVGQIAAARDMEGNIRKADEASSSLSLSFPPLKGDGQERCSSSSSIETSPAPCLRTLLLSERAKGTHGPNAALSDPSAAIALLWLRRSLAFQYDMYDALLRSPDVDPALAAWEAYRAQMEPYHGWVLRRFFGLMFSPAMMPERTRADILAALGGIDGPGGGGEGSALCDDGEKEEEEEEKLVLRDLEDLVSIWKPILCRWTQIFVDLDLEDNRRV